MNNGDSFHNGSENLELQLKNRRGPSEETADASAAEPTESPAALPAESTPAASPEAPKPPVAPSPVYDPTQEITAPHKRPYVNIYAAGAGISYSAGSRPQAAAPVTPPAERGYTNIYARRTAERTEETPPGHFSNTPDPAEGLPYYEDMTESAAGRAKVSPVYASSAYSDETAEAVHKNKFNIASLILGIASFAGNLLCLTCLTPITAILAIIFGCMGRVSGKFEQKGLTGFILGIVYWALAVLLFLFVFILAIVDSAYSAGVPLE